MRSTAVVLLLLATVLAGCSGNPTTTPATAASSSPSSGGPLNNATAVNLTKPHPVSRIGLSGCLQQHTFFPFPIAAFQGSQPAGWSFAPSQTGGANFVDVFIATNQCKQGDLTMPDGSTLTLSTPMQVDFTIPVVLPKGFAEDANVTLELVALGGFLSSSDGSALYEAWGLAPWYGKGAFDSLFNGAGPARVDQVQATAGNGGVYTITSDITAGTGPFDAVYRIWIPKAPGVIGDLRVANSNATTVGSGQALFRYVGTDGIPPANPGTSHVVDGARVETTWEPLRLGQ